MKCKRGKDYIVAVDGKWIGKYHYWEGVTYFSPFVRCSVKSAQRMAKGKKGTIEIFQTWGSFPEHRKVVKTIRRGE